MAFRVPDVWPHQNGLLRKPVGQWHEEHGEVADRVPPEFPSPLSAHYLHTCRRTTLVKLAIRRPGLDDAGSAYRLRRPHQGSLERSRKFFQSSPYPWCLYVIQSPKPGRPARMTAEKSGDLSAVFAVMRQDEKWLSLCGCSNLFLVCSSECTLALGDRQQSWVELDKRCVHSRVVGVATVTVSRQGNHLDGFPVIKARQLFLADPRTQKADQLPF
jgi:hypothetical protein